MYLRFLNQKGFYGFAGGDINIAWLGRTVPSNHRADSIDHVSYTVSSAVDAVFVIFYSLPILISNLSLFLHKDWFVMLSCVVVNLSYVFYCDGFSLQARLDSAHGFTCVVNVLFFLCSECWEIWYHLILLFVLELCCQMSEDSTCLHVHLFLYFLPNA